MLQENRLIDIEGDNISNERAGNETDINASSLLEGKRRHTVNLTHGLPFL